MFFYRFHPIAVSVRGQPSQAWLVQITAKGIIILFGRVQEPPNGVFILARFELVGVRKKLLASGPTISMTMEVDTVRCLGSKDDYLVLAKIAVESSVLCLSWLYSV